MRPWRILLHYTMSSGLPLSFFSYTGLSNSHHVCCHVSRCYGPSVEIIFFYEVKKKELASNTDDVAKVRNN